MSWFRSRENMEARPRGAVSFLLTMAIPFLTADLFIRFSASDTDWPALAVVTSALAYGDEHAIPAGYVVRNYRLRCMLRITVP